MRAKYCVAVLVKGHYTREGDRETRTPTSIPTFCARVVLLRRKREKA